MLSQCGVVTEDEKKTWGADARVQMKLKFFHDGSLAGDADEQDASAWQSGWVARDDGGGAG